MYTLGIDIGSTTSKAILLEDGREVKAAALVQAGTGTDGPELVFARVLEKSGLRREEIDRVMATGYGRRTFSETDDEMSELSCHARGIAALWPETRTIIDIGGQDAKVIQLNGKGQMMNFAMNDKCAAGTGRFLDVMAGILHLEISDLEKKAAQSETAVKISSTCTVFAESEVISQLANGASVPDVVSGICNSVAARTASLVKRVGVREQVFMSGGVAGNGGVRRALERELGVTVHYSRYSQLMGAYGAALCAADRESRRQA